MVDASLERFVHKDEQIECIHRIVCHGRDVLAVLSTGLGKSATYQLIFSKVLFCMGRTANATSKTTAELLVFCWLTNCNGTFTKFCFWNLLIANETRGRVLQKKPIHLSAVLCSTACKFRLFVPCVIPAHEATSGSCVWFILIRRRYRRHSRWQIF